MLIVLDTRTIILLITHALTVVLTDCGDEESKCLCLLMVA